MPIFEKPPLEALAPAKDRWTPIYLEHGRLEVDDSSVKWLGADGLMCRLPVATISAIILGPGTTITHAAVKACADSNTPVCWTGAEGLSFYAYGLAPNHTNDMPRIHATAWADSRRHTRVARSMFRMRFPGSEVDEKSVAELRGMEGIRVRQVYAELGREHGVSWKARNYDTRNWELADDINQALSTANASLYALCSAVICSLGYLPSLGFIHDAGTTPFVFDVADLYKHETTQPAAFLAVRQEPRCNRELVRRFLKEKIEERRILQRMPKDLAALFGTGEAEPQAAGDRPPSAIR
jgi:CRISPR-associated protein Cas1